MYKMSKVNELAMRYMKLGLVSNGMIKSKKINGLALKNNGQLYLLANNIGGVPFINDKGYIDVVESDVPCVSNLLNSDSVINHFKMTKHLEITSASDGTLSLEDTNDPLQLQKNEFAYGYNPQMPQQPYTPAFRMEMNCSWTLTEKDLGKILDRFNIRNNHHTYLKVWAYNDSVVNSETTKILTANMEGLKDNDIERILSDLPMPLIVYMHM